MPWSRPSHFPGSSPKSAPGCCPPRRPGPRGCPPPDREPTPGTLASPCDPAAATIAATGAGGGADTGARAGYLLDPDAATSPRPGRGSWLSRTASRFRLARRRTQILLSLALLALVTGAVTAAVVLAAPEPPAVVPYPAVTGDLGQHLQELQKSVEP